ncbi:MAG: crotonase/enoyl-CoA hydratase family protein [Pseudomonadota bacterium]
MKYETLLFETDSRGIATLTLNRPDKHNAMSATMIRELTDVASTLAGDSRIRLVVLTGTGTSFCAGGDLAWMRAQMSAPRTQRIAEARALAMMLKALNELPQAVIGRINGQAFGGGVGLMCICDMTVAVHDARFGLTETRLGLIPATISPYVLARMGEGRARQIFMSSRRFGCDEAVELGLLGRSVGASDLDAAIAAELEPYLGCSPDAVARSKALLRALGTAIDDAVIDQTIERLADTWETGDAHEGVSAFFERRKPRWANDT